jgi:hypothetical protein
MHSRRNVQRFHIQESSGQAAGIAARDLIQIIMRKCPVCSSGMAYAFSATVLGKHEVSYHRCAECGLVQTEEPYWLEEAYSNAIAIADTGLVQRNIANSAKLAALLYFCFEPRGAYADVAGGYGMLTRLMRDLGFDFYWEDRYTENLLARGFEADKAGLHFAGVTAFEVLEHLPDPVGFLSALMQKFAVRTVIFSTETYSGAAAPDNSWWYYAFGSGQHISFFQMATLQKIADRLNVHLYSIGGMHVLSDKPLPNVQIARFFAGRLAFPLAVLIRRRLGSRTMDDHRKLIGGN